MDVVPLCLQACVVQVVSTALQTRQASSLQNGRFLDRGVGRLFLLHPVWEEVVGYCYGCRIETCAPVRRVAVRVVGRVPVFIPRRVRG